jgi:hypothetical protein
MSAFLSQLKSPPTPFPGAMQSSTITVQKLQAENRLRNAEGALVAGRQAISRDWADFARP